MGLLPELTLTSLDLGSRKHAAVTDSDSYQCLYIIMLLAFTAIWFWWFISEMKVSTVFLSQTPELLLNSTFLVPTCPLVFTFEICQSHLSEGSQTPDLCFLGSDCWCLLLRLKVLTVPLISASCHFHMEHDLSISSSVQTGIQIEKKVTKRRRKMNAKLFNQIIHE